MWELVTNTSRQHLEIFLLVGIFKVCLYWGKNQPESDVACFRVLRKCIVLFIRNQQRSKNFLAFASYYKFKSSWRLRWQWILSNWDLPGLGSAELPGGVGLEYPGTYLGWVRLSFPGEWALNTRGYHHRSCSQRRLPHSAGTPHPWPRNGVWKTAKNLKVTASIRSLSECTPCSIEEISDICFMVFICHSCMIKPYLMLHFL